MAYYAQIRAKLYGSIALSTEHCTHLHIAMTGWSYATLRPARSQTNTFWLAVTSVRILAGHASLRLGRQDLERNLLDVLGLASTDKFLAIAGVMGCAMAREFVSAEQ